jgi:hypothetical protein
MFSNAILTVEDEFGRTKEIYLEGSSCRQPDDITGLAIWLRADKIRISDVQDVAGDYMANVFPDDASNGFDAYPPKTTERPFYISSAIGSRPALQFDGGQCMVVDPGSGNNIITGSMLNNGTSTFMVFNHILPTTSGYLLYPTYSTNNNAGTFPRIRPYVWNWDSVDGSSAGGWEHANWTRLQIYGYNRSRYPDNSTTENYNFKAMDYALTMSMNAETETADLWLNGEHSDLTVLSFTSWGVPTADTLSYGSTVTRNRQVHYLFIGAYHYFDTSTTSTFANGYISEIFIYSSRLSDTEIGYLNLYMMEKYGITAF